MEIVCSKAPVNHCKISAYLDVSLTQTNENRPFPAGGMIKTRTIFTDNPFINHGNKMAIMTAAQWRFFFFFFTSSAVSRQQKRLNSDEKKGRLGFQESGTKSPLSVVFPMRKGDELMPKRGLENAGYYS